MPEVFCKLNQCPNTQEWKQEKAAAIYDKYEELKLTQIAEDSSLDDSTLLLEATGGKNKRGRAYGFGSEVAFFGSSRSQNECHTSDQIIRLEGLLEQLQGQLEEQKQMAQQREQRHQQEIKDERERMQVEIREEIRAEMQEQMQKFFQQFHHMSSPP